MSYIRYGMLYYRPKINLRVIKQRSSNKPFDYQNEALDWKKNLSPGLILVKKRLYLLYGTIVLKKDGRKKRKYLQEKSKLHFKIFAMDECLYTTTNKTYNLNSAYIHYSLEALYKNITPKTAILLQEGWHRCGRDGMTNVKILAKEISYLDDMTKSYSWIKIIMN